LIYLLETSWLNTLSTDAPEFVSISTATVAPPDVANDVLMAHNVGQEAYHEFKRTCLETHPPTAQFHDKMTRKNLKTFSSIRKKPSSKTRVSNSC